MPGLRLECHKKGYRESLLPYLAILGEYLYPATVNALGAKPGGVDLTLTDADIDNGPALLLEGMVSEGKTPSQDMDVWRLALQSSWEVMRHADRLKPVAHILNDTIGFWQHVLYKGTYDELPAKG